LETIVIREYFHQFTCEWFQIEITISHKLKSRYLTETEIDFQSIQIFKTVTQK